MVMPHLLASKSVVVWSNKRSEFLDNRGLVRHNNAENQNYQSEPQGFSEFIREIINLIIMT